MAIFDYNPSAITPFPYWRWNKVLPAVYDDSVSQYEMLCRLLSVVNNIIESTNSTGEQVEALTQLVQQLIDGEFPSGIVSYVQQIVDAIMADNIEAINASIENIRHEIDASKGNAYPISAFYYEGDTDYTAAWNRIIALLSDGDVIDIDTTINGTFVLDKGNVIISGAGIIESPITIDVRNSNPNPDNIKLSNLTFDVSDNVAINLIAAYGISIEGCSFKTDQTHAAISAVKDPDYNQQIRQIRISNCHFYGGYSVYFEPETIPLSGVAITYPVADVHIVNCEMNNLIKNVHIVSCDGGIISNNTMFLSQGGTNKLQNIYVNIMSYMIISSNQLFEAGSSAIYVGRNNRAVINGNNIVWPGQYQAEAAILFEQGTTYNTGQYGNHCLNNVSNNSIEAPSGHGIYNTTKKYTSYVGNYIYAAGSTDHWKSSSVHPSGSYYGIYDTSDGAMIFSNLNLVSYGIYAPNSNDMRLNVGNLNTLDISQNIIRNIASPVASTITDASSISYSQRSPLFVVNSVVSMTTQEFLNNFNGYTQPLIGYVVSYSGSLTVGGTQIIGAGSQAMFIIYGNNVRWIK